MLIFTEKCTQGPHFCMQLSGTEWYRVKENAVIVNGLFGNDLKLYDDITMGVNIKAPLTFHITWCCNSLERAEFAPFEK